MRKYFYIFFLTIFVIPFNIQAQLVPTSDSLGVVESPAPSYEIVVHNTITNTTTDSIEVKWIMTTNEIPTSWGNTSFCDKINCAELSERTFFLAPDSSSAMDVHFINNGRTGEGYAEVIYFDITDSSSTVQTLKYYGKATNETTAIKELDTKSISIFPNPASNYIQIKGIENTSLVKTLEVYNIIGRKLISKEINSSNDLNVNIQNYESGIYLVKLFDETKNIFYTKTFIKK